MTLIKLPDGKQEYVNDLDDLIDISSEYIGYDYSRILENEIRNQIEDTKEDYYEKIYCLEENKEGLDNLIISIRTRLEKISDNIDKISMEDVQDIVDDILTDI